MKKDSSFFIVYLIPIVVIGVFWTIQNLFLVERDFREQIYEQLKNIADFKRERVEDLLDEKKRDARFLANLNEIKSLFDLEVDGDQGIMREDVNNSLEILSQRIESHLLTHSGLTANDLINSNDFIEVNVSGIGNKGGLFLFDPNDFSGELRGSRLELSGQDIDFVRNAISEAVENNEVEGEFYFGDVIDGDEEEEFKSRYLSFKIISAGVGVGAFGDVDDYQIIKQVPEKSEEKFRLFVDDFEYKDLLLISLDGGIIYEANHSDYLGRNINWISRYDVSDALERVKADKDFFVSGPFSGTTRGSLEFLVFMPVMEMGEVKGVIVIINDFNEVFDIFTDISGLGDNGDNYLINSHGLLITPLRFRQLDLLIQRMEGDIFNDCLSGSNEKSLEIIKDEKSGVYEFRNYFGQMALGVGNLIPNTNWCQIVEISYEDNFDRFRKERIVNQVSILAFSVLGIIIFFLIRRFLINRVK